MYDQFSLWTNGFGFGVFVLSGIILMMVSQSDNAVKRACVLMAANLFYLALRLPIFAFLPADSPFYIGHQSEVIAMFSMSTGVMVNLVLMQLTHYAHVDLRKSLSHLLCFLHVILLFYLFALLGKENLAIYCFRFYVLVTILYVVTFTFLIIRSFRRYEKELSNTYVNTENRSLNWFRTISILAIALFIGNMVSNLVFQGHLVSDIYHLFVTFLWSYFAYKVATMRESYLSYANDEVGTGDEVENIEAEAAEAKAEEVNAFMERLRETLENGGLLFDEDLTRDDVMHAMSVTHVTLGRNLHAATGMTFSSYVTDLRLERIAELLLKSDDSIEHIYYTCGFRSRTTFYRAFSRKFSCSPAEYRRNHGH